MNLYEKNLADIAPLPTNEQLQQTEGEHIARLKRWMGGEGDGLADADLTELYEEFCASFSANWLIDDWDIRGCFCGFLANRLLYERGSR